MKFKLFFSILFSLSILFSSSKKVSFHSTYASSLIKQNIWSNQITHDINIWEDNRATHKTILNFEYLGEEESGIIFKLPYVFKTNTYDKKFGYGDVEFGVYFVASKSADSYSRYDFLYKRTVVGDYISPVIMGNITGQHVGGISYSIDLDKTEHFFITSKLEYLYVSGTSLDFEDDPGWTDFIEPKHVFNFNADIILKNLPPKNFSILAGLNYHYSNTRIELTNINSVSNYIGESLSIGGQQYYPTEIQASSLGVKCELVYRKSGKINMDLGLKVNLNLYDNFNSPNLINFSIKFI
tara:strand:+ start:4757 stop:5644 length:888 start_codon:yes stop_codon:yes gene_type:complete